MLVEVGPIDVLCRVHFVPLRMMNRALQICTEQLFKWLLSNGLARNVLILPKVYMQLGEAICPTQSEIFFRDALD